LLDSADARHRLFVYGTLRRGGCRAIPTLFPTARFLGFGTVRGRLYDFGDYPGLRLDPNGLDILGEVYEVDAHTLRVIDDIEDYYPDDVARSHYVRRTHRIRMWTGDYLTAELYECNPRYYDCSQPLDATDWIAWKQCVARRDER
jgi:gamma-glutamylcyclotransferase (GGCT)/AIG2-like uncharacterized protein YtfP